MSRPGTREESKRENEKFCFEDHAFELEEAENLMCIFFETVEECPDPKQALLPADNWKAWYFIEHRFLTYTSALGAAFDKIRDVRKALESETERLAKR